MAAKIASVPPSGVPGEAGAAGGAKNVGAGAGTGAAVAAGGVPPGELPRGRPIALVLGTEEQGVAPVTAALMGVITGCVGGIIRDVLAGRPSILMRPELYVTAAALAALLCVVGTLLAWADWLVWPAGPPVWPTRGEGWPCRWRC